MESSSTFIFGEASNHYMGESELTYDEIEQRMDEHKTVPFYNVRQVVTFNIPHPKGINRLTRLVTVDIALGPVEKMTVHPTSIQQIEKMMPAIVELIQTAEQEELKGRADKAGLATV